MRVLKGESSKLLKGTRDKFWQTRYYDFNTFTTGKFVEKIQYIHTNPVTRGLVANPEDYRRSSFNHYATGQSGTIQIDSADTPHIYGLAQTVEDNLLIISGLVLAKVLQSIGDSMAAVYGKGLGHSRADWYKTRRSHTGRLFADED